MPPAARALTTDSIAAKLDELPTLPTIVYELSRVVNDPMSSTHDVEKLMANDQSLTTKVLRLVNSAYYAIPGGVTSLSRAIAYIGFDTVNQLVLSASILKALETKGPQRFDMNGFWKHAIGVAIASETIAKIVSHPMPSDLFTCGLVHDMGKVALYTVDMEAMLSIVDTAKADQSTYSEAETKLGIPSHTVIGAMLAARWTLPAAIQAVIKHHHTKEPGLRGGLTAELNLNVDIVSLANLLTHALKFGNSGHDKILGAPKELLERLTIHPERDFKNVLQEIKKSMDKAADFLRVLGGGQ
jgi:putative nucleotidyltransferase with HDIG domain